MNLLKSLTGGDLRSIGKANLVVKKVGNNQILFDEVFAGIWDKDPIIRMRAADTIEKVSQQHPDLLKKHKTEIIKGLDTFEQQEVKWHIAQIIPHIRLTKKELNIAINILSKWLADKDESNIVRVNSMQALADLSIINNNAKEQTLEIVKKYLKNNTPSLRSRAKKILMNL